MKYILVWLALSIALLVGLGRLNWPFYHRLTIHGVEGQGTVVELLPKIHGTLRYKYQVEGKTFEGQQQPWQPNPDLDRLRVGQSVVIYYDPAHPSDSVLGDPKPMLKNETISIAVAATIFPTMIIGSWRWQKRRRRGVFGIRLWWKRNFTNPPSAAAR